MRLIIPRIGSELMTKFRGKKPTKQKNKRTNNKSNTINKFQSSGWKPPTLTTWRCWCDVTIVRTNQRQSTSATLLPSFENQNSNFKQTKWNNEIIEIDVMKSNQWQNQWNHRLKVVEYPRPPIGLWRHPLLLPLPHPFLNFLNFWPCLALPPLPWGCLRFPKATTPPPLNLFLLPLTLESTSKAQNLSHLSTVASHLPGKSVASSTKETFPPPPPPPRFQLLRFHSRWCPSVDFILRLLGAPRWDLSLFRCNSVINHRCDEVFTSTNRNGSATGQDARNNTHQPQQQQQQQHSIQ